MLTSVFTKTIRDRWMGVAIATALISVWLPVAMAIYRDIDLTLYTDLPQGIRELMGIPDGADAATLAYSVMLEFAAALTFGGLAISMGSAAIAGEERKGTIGLLLGNPTGRTQVLVSKIASMLLLIMLATGVLWGVARLSAVVLDVSIGDTRLGAMALHLGVNTVFYGLLAIAIGAWTGNGTLSSAVAAGIMTLSYFAVGLLPLVAPLANGARLFPWFYFSSTQPLNNGVDWGHLGVLTIGAVGLGSIAVLGVNRRDLRNRSVGASLLDRLRANERTRRVFERLAGSTRVSRPWIKTATEHQGLLFVTAAIMFVIMGVLMGPMYTAIEADIANTADDFPEVVMALAGGGDLATPEGWFEAETFSLMAPIAVMVVTVVIGSRGLAGEEAKGTMGLLLANPIKRSRIVVEQSIAMGVYAAVVGLATFAGVAIANLIWDLEMSYVGIGATSVLVTLLGLVFGALALALSAATGLMKVAVYGTAFAAITSHLFNSFLPLSSSLAEYAKLTPHHYLLGSDPLVNGMHWGHGSLLTAVAVGLVAMAVMLFDRRDLRQG